MLLFEFNRKESAGEEEFPLLGVNAKVSVAIDFGDIVVPPRAARRIAFHTLRDIMESMSEDELTPQNASEHREQEPIVAALARRSDNWRKPDELDMRVIKSAHRIVLEVSKRGVGGRSVLASDLVGSIGLSAPTVGRLLKDGDPGHEYLAPFVSISPHGRTKALDLTAEGRILASKIRAGSIPA